MPSSASSAHGESALHTPANTRKRSAARATAQHNPHHPQQPGMRTQGAQHGQPFRVQVICNTGLEYFRNVILGIRQYSFTTGSIELCDRWLSYAEGDLADLVREEQIDGIIAQVESVGLQNRLLRMGVACVNISNSLPVQRLPLVTQDDESVGQLAAEHLLLCGCAAFGFWGHANAGYSTQRRIGMHAMLRKRAPNAPFFARESKAPEVVDQRALVSSMATWLQTLPKPAGVFSVLDTYGMLLLRAARRVGLRVPEDIAILCAGDDEFWVGYESIPLSSIRLPSQNIGFEAARLLNTILNARADANAPAPAESLRLPSAGLSVRQSSDVLFTGDEAVQKAIAFLRNHSTGNIGVPDLVRASGICRSALQIRFRKAIGHSILDEIHRNRLNLVQSLLRTTDLKLTDIAERCHFPDSPRLSAFFKKATGLTPRQYRLQFAKLP